MFSSRQEQSVSFVVFLSETPILLFFAKRKIYILCTTHLKEFTTSDGYEIVLDSSRKPDSFSWFLELSEQPGSRFSPSDFRDEDG